MSSTNEKRDFIGSIVAGILVKKGVEVAVEKGMEALAKSPSSKVSEKDVAPGTAVVTKEINKEVVDQVMHQTNAEPAYQSRVAQGSALAIVMAITTVWQYATDNVVQGPELWTPPLVVIAGGAWALYGRFIAKKAFWSK